MDAHDYRPIDTPAANRLTGLPVAGDPAPTGLPRAREPFEQAAASARLARRARALGGSVVTYSGYTSAYLRRSTLPEVQELLDATDLLIAGPFVATKKTDGRGWHGSTNQEFVFLSARYDESIRAQFDEAPVVEVWADGRIADWSGIPDASPLEDALPPVLSMER